MMKITIEHEITDQDIEDHLICALEGGSNYWYYLPDITNAIQRYPNGVGMATSEKVVRSVLQFGEVIPVYDIEDHDHKLGDLSRDNIKRGFELYSKTRRSLDPGECDAEDADVLFQLIVMGEVVYG